MIGNITIGQFFPGDSPVHRVDPRIKILLTAAYITAVFVVRGFWGYAYMALALFYMAARSQVRIVSFWCWARPS